MKQYRLDNLSDGIFAIILTFLTFDLKIPNIPRLPPQLMEAELWRSLVQLMPVFLSFILSFALIFTYWRAHHYISSVYAKNIDVQFTTINAVFFFFICLIPFSARLLGEYSDTKIAITLYGLNVIFIGLSLLWMRIHVFSSKYIDHAIIKEAERRRGVIRVILPVICAIAAIGLSFISTKLSFSLFTFAIVFNLFSRSTRYMNKVIELLHSSHEEEMEYEREPDLEQSQ
jgi:uncharacterized membrane protein